VRNMEQLHTHDPLSECDLQPHYMKQNLDIGLCTTRKLGQAS